MAWEEVPRIHRPAESIWPWARGFIVLRPAQP